MLGIGHVLTAASYRISRNSQTDLAAVHEPWQTRAFNYYDALGEVHYSSQFYAKGLSGVRFFPARKDPNGDLVEIESGQELDIFNELQDLGGGTKELQTTYGRLRFIAGECYLLIAPDEDAMTGKRCEMVSLDELRVDTSGAFSRFYAPGLSSEQMRSVETTLSKAERLKDNFFKPLPSDTEVYRLWRKHPRFSALADSPMRSCLDICEELLLFTQVVRARVRSRLASSGILLLAEEMGLPPLEPTGDEDMMLEPLTRDLIAAAMASIKNPGAAEAVVPIIMRVKGEYLKEGAGWAHIKIHDPKDTYPETGLRDEQIRRLAISLDFDPAELLGTSDVNHWGSWMIDENRWKTHLLPVAQEYASDILSAYWRPACVDANIASPETLAIGIDPSDVVNHPDKAKDAKDDWDRGAIGYETLRDATGFNDDDAPTEEEFQIWLGLKTGDPSVALYGLPSASPASQPVDETQPTDQTPAGVEPGPPSGAARVETTLAAMLMGGAEVAVERCREVAGAKIRSQTAKCKTTACTECASMIDGVPNSLVASTLGPDRVSGLKSPPAIKLVSGGAESFVASAARAHQVESDFAQQLGDLIENHAALTLFESSAGRIPSGFAGMILRGVR